MPPIQADNFTDSVCFAPIRHSWRALNGDSHWKTLYQWPFGMARAAKLGAKGREPGKVPALFRDRSDHALTPSNKDYSAFARSPAGGINHPNG
jgi:hypothetical protein